MAKLRYIQPVEGMEEEMGFKLNLSESLFSGSTALSGVLTPRLFTNLESVSNDRLERTEKEHDEFIRVGHEGHNRSIPLERGQTEVSVGD